jgi:hypothetical protein
MGKNEWADAVFYMHELSEATLMSKGMPYEVTHWEAIAKYSVNPQSIYAPEVIQQFPELFNPSWFEFWNIPLP